MPPMISVRIEGTEALKAKLGHCASGSVIRAGLRRGALVVQADAQRRVHSPDNQYVGKAGYSVATGRLQASIGISAVTDHEVRIGTPYGKGGLAGQAFGRSSRANARNGRPGRTGRRVNRGDPNVYGPIEERRHPFLEPALTSNIDAIESAIRHYIAEALAK